jgi:hypothetical protein
MKRKFNNHLRMLKQSIDWWREESLKTSFEVEKINDKFEKGIISESEVLDELSELNDRMDYLYRKGFYEQKNLFEFFSTTLK